MSWLFGGGAGKSKGSVPTASSSRAEAKVSSRAGGATLDEDDDGYDVDADLEKYMASSEFGASVDDGSLNAELAALGFTEDLPAPRAKGAAAAAAHAAPPARGAISAVPKSKPISNLSAPTEDFDYADTEAAEAALQLTDDDLRDPELLAALSQVQSAVEAELTNNEDEHSDKLVGRGSTTDAMDSDRLRQVALSLHAQGRDGEAVEVMRLAAARGPQDIIVQRRLEEAERASRQVPGHSGASLLVRDGAIHEADDSGSQQQQPSAPSSAGAPCGTAEQAKLEAVRLKRSGQVSEAVAWLKYAKAVEAGSLAAVPRPGEASGDSGAIRQAVPPPAAPGPAVKASTTNTSRTAVGKSVAGAAPPRNAGAAATAATPLAVPISPFGADSFAPLEAALVEAINMSHKRALAAKKELESDEMKNSPAGASARKTATNSLANYKKYQQELAVLQSRKGMPGARPAPFRWKTIRIETPVENKHLAEDQMELVINNIRDMEATISDQSSRSMSINYSIPLSRDNPISGTVPAGRYIDGKGLSFGFKAIIPLKRGRSLQIQLERKKATFDIVMHRGYFSSDLTVATVSLSLGDMLTKVDCGGDSLPMTKDGKKSVGGVMSAYIRLRKPLVSPQVMVEEERELIVESWPEVLVSPSAPDTTPTAAGVNDSESLGIGASEASTAVVATSPAIQTSDAGAVANTPAGVAGSRQPDGSEEISEAAKKAMADFAGRLSDKEMRDPMNVDFLESNDVMDAEVEFLTSQLRTPQLSEDDQFALGLRLQLVQNKLQLLVMSVQNETLSLEDYLTRIRDRLQRDKVLALFCKAAGDMASAVRIMKRIKIMQTEIDNASG
jgi:hypothetical protein